MSSISNVDNAVRPGPKYFSSTLPAPFHNLELGSNVAFESLIDSVPKEFTKLTHRLFLTPMATQRRVIAFIGCDETTDSRCVCSNVARLLAFQTGEPVCFLDINERRLAGPRLHNANAAGSEQGEVLMRPEAVRNLARDLGGNLWSLAVDSPKDRTLSMLTAARFGALMTQVQSEFRYALIAAPPMFVETASIPICAAAEAVVLVLGSATKRTSALEAMRLLRSMDMIVAGAVLEQARH